MKQGSRNYFLMKKDQGRVRESMKRRVSRGWALVVVCAVALSAAGCSPAWKKKFIRKKKTPQGYNQPIFVLQTGTAALLPPPVLYKERYAYWKYWHRDLLATLGRTKKRDVRYLGGVIGELRAMSDILQESSADDRLIGIISELNKMHRQWRASLDSYRSSSIVRQKLERLQRELDRDYHFSKVKEWIPDSWPRTEGSSGGKKEASENS